MLRWKRRFWLVAAAAVLLTVFLGLAARARLDDFSTIRHEVDGDREAALVLAARVVRQFEATPPLSRYYGALYSQRLPEVLRLPVGIMEAVTMPSDCDSMARGLVYALRSNGIAARQADLFSDQMTHSVVEAVVDGRPALLDPYLNVYFEHPDGRIASPHEVVRGLRDLQARPFLAAKPSRATMYRRMPETRTRILYTGEPGTIPVWIDGRELLPGRGPAVARPDEWEGIGVGATFLGPRYGGRRDKTILARNLPPGGLVETVFHLEDDLSEAPTTEPPGQCRLTAPSMLRCALPPAGIDGRASLLIEDSALSTVTPVVRFEARLGH